MMFISYCTDVYQLALRKAIAAFATMWSMVGSLRLFATGVWLGLVALHPSGSKAYPAPLELEAAQKTVVMH